MELPLAPIIEQAECHVAALLDFCNDEARADRVNCSRGHENDVTGQHSAPHDKFANRAIGDGLTQSLRCQTLP